MKTSLGTETANDAQLVEWSLTGDREAFGRIVERYQSLVCSITYGATGSVSLSEDIAQETFLTAWRELAKLSDATRLRGWLCGIARNLLNNSLRRGQREPVHTSEPLDAIHEPASPEPSPSAEAVSREEEAIVWNALEKIPETYREPLILFYRKGQSVERVAEEMELSEDAVKQRLSRGRKMLTDEVAAFVEGTLKRTTPGRTFSAGVLAALPVASTVSKAAVAGAAVVKGASATKSALTLGSAGGLLAMLGGSYFGIRAGIENTKSPRERQYVIRRMSIGIGLVILGLALVFGFRNRLHELGVRFGHDRFVHDVTFATTMFVLAVCSAVTFEYGNRRRRQIQMEEGTWVESDWTAPEKPGRFTLDSLHSGSKTSVYTAMGLVLFAAGYIVLAIQEALAGHGAFALLMVGLVLWGMRNWRRAWGRLPRFDASLSTLLRFVAGFGLFTLFVCDMHFFRGQGPVFDLRTIVFHVVVVLAYAALIGFLAWRHKRRRSSAEAASS